MLGSDDTDDLSSSWPGKFGDLGDARGERRLPCEMFAMARPRGLRWEDLPVALLIDDQLLPRLWRAAAFLLEDGVAGEGAMVLPSSSCTASSPGSSAWMSSPPSSEGVLGGALRGKPSSSMV